MNMPMQIDRALRQVPEVRVRIVLLLLLCAPYLQGGLAKLFDFGAAQAEMAHFGLEPTPLFAVLAIITELLASALVLAGKWRWLGAGWLALFTASATWIANRFWELPPGQRLMDANTFFEHIALVGALLWVAWDDLRNPAR